MSIIGAITLLGIMAALAAIPSTSVALVVVRSATLGVGNGIAVAIGIVLGDLLFIMLAILGLSVISETMGSLFLVIKYLGATYLIWLGLSLLKQKASMQIATRNSSNQRSLLSSLLAGIALTLGDVKAIIFYISLFPMFVDLATLQLFNIIIIMFITIVSVGGIKVLYAFSAAKIASKAKDLKFANAARKIAGGLMIGAGGYIIIKT